MMIGLFFTKYQWWSICWLWQGVWQTMWC